MSKTTKAIIAEQMQAKEQAQHTPGAVKAATAIIKEWGDFGVREAEIVDAYATVIDRETAAPELLEACKVLIAQVSEDDSVALKYGGKLGIYLTSDQIQLFRAAIAKAEGREP